MIMSRTSAELESYFRKQIRRPVILALTDNVRSMVSWREDSGGIRLRLHRMFADAPTDVLEAVADWITSPPSGRSTVRAYMKANRTQVREPAPTRERNIYLRPRGKYHDLDKIFARLNAEYFDSRLEMRITWGRRSRKRYARHICLGTWCEETKVITISPRLDRRNVPAYFVEYVVYHEMVHADLGVSRNVNGRRRIHTKAFHAREQQFREYERARAYEKLYFW